MTDATDLDFMAGRHNVQSNHLFIMTDNTYNFFIDCHSMQMSGDSPFVWIHANLDLHGRFIFQYDQAVQRDTHLESRAEGIKLNRP